MNSRQIIRKFFGLGMTAAMLVSCKGAADFDNYKALCRDHIYADYKQMYRDGGRECVSAF